MSDHTVGWEGKHQMYTKDAYAQQDTAKCEVGRSTRCRALVLQVFITAQFQRKLNLADNKGELRSTSLKLCTALAKASS